MASVKERLAEEDGAPIASSFVGVEEHQGSQSPSVYPRPPKGQSVLPWHLAKKSSVL